MDRHRNGSETRRRRSRADARFHGMKRAIDVVGATALLVLCSPLLLGCALWIRLVDGGPVFYSQWRVGRHGVLFRIHKLRTMRKDAERRGVQWASRNDPRILP